MSKVKMKEINICIRTTQFSMLDRVFKQILKDCQEGKEICSDSLGNSKYWISLHYTNPTKPKEKVINKQIHKIIKSKL